MNTPTNADHTPMQSEQAEPQPQPEQTEPQPQAKSQQGGRAAEKQTPSTRAIVAVTAAVGGVALLAVGASVAYASIAPYRFDPIGAFVGNAATSVTSSSVNSEDPDAGSAQMTEDGDGTFTHVAPIEDVRALELEIAGAGIEVAFGDVGEAALVVTGDRAADWRMAVQEGRLIVETPDRGLTSGCLFNCGASALGNASATLTLPQEMSDDGSLDAEMSLEGGVLTGSGSFRSLDLSVQAGSLRVEGSAQNVDVDVEAGKAELDLADVTAAEVGVETGSVRLGITGAAPDRVSVDASTGSAALDLPDAEYRVEATTELGELDDRLSKSDDAKHVVTVRAEAAKVTLD